jgi:glycosyltransferase involved in cell wall biosynthesis
MAVTGVSLIMATAGRVHEIQGLLASLEKQTCGAFELIAVDQNGDDRLLPVLAKARESGMTVRHVKHAVRSLSGARNAGLAHARYEVVAFPDDDCWYEARVIQQVTESFARDARLDGLVARWAEVFPGSTGMQTLRLGRVRRLRGIVPSSISLFLRTSLVRRIGGFDRMLGMPGWFGSGEDTDLVMRCLSEGAVLRYRPDVTVHHPCGPGDGRETRRAGRLARLRARGTGALYAKHRLAPLVILRGLSGPLARTLVPTRRGMKRALVHVCVTVGRLEGVSRWLYLSCRRPREIPRRGPANGRGPR